MSTEIMTKCFIVTIFSLVFALTIFSRYDTENGTEGTDSDRQRYLPYIAANLLSLFLPGLAVSALILYGIPEAARLILSLCFGIFLHIGLYYIILIPVLPFLRRRISARACAVLWMIPNFLYLTQLSYMKLPGPLLVIHAPGNLVWILFYVWLAGFFIILVRKILSHLIFRSQILKNTTVISDPAILELWNIELGRANIRKPGFQPVVSPNVISPLSVGLFRRSVQIVLPEQHYTHDELSLIFRHELIHIGREDAWSKFFLTFCTAMCWFNPFMWIAMGKCAEDLELSCDETVLLNAGENTRRQYAELILKTAGNDRGFTTCLSASASAVRYRLKNIMKPGKRHSGALAAGILFFLLFMTYGYIALSYDCSAGAEVIYQSKDTSLYTLTNITLTDDSYTDFDCTDPEAFHEYMAGLSMDRLTGNYSFTDTERQLEFRFDTPEGILVIELSDHAVKLIPLYGQDRRTSCYYLPDGIDWKYMDTLITAH